MTMPDERTRSLRFGWEFLIELRDCDSLTDDQRKTVEEILLDYPSTAEIRQWAKDCELETPEKAITGPFLAPEEPRPYVDSGEPAFPDDLERGPTTPQERAQALKDAQALFRQGLAGSKKDNPPERLRGYAGSPWTCLSTPAAMGSRASTSSSTASRCSSMS